jgi:hypothetical protein
MHHKLTRQIFMIAIEPDRAFDCSLFVQLADSVPSYIEV